MANVFATQLLEAFNDNSLRWCRASLISGPALVLVSTGREGVLTVPSVVSLLDFTGTLFSSTTDESDHLAAGEQQAASDMLAAAV